MKNISKVSLALLTAAVMSTSVYASGDNNGYERVQSARGSVEALATTLENMGANVDTSVDLNGAYTFDQKAAVYQDKHDQLQAQFDALHAQSAE